MQAIKTKYHGPTNARSSRISVQCEAGKIYVTYAPELDVVENHRAACDALIKKMGWDAEYYADVVGGLFDGCYYWVFDDKRLKAIREWVALTQKATPTGNPWVKKEFIALVECVARSEGFHGAALDWVPKA